MMDERKGAPVGWSGKTEAPWEWFRTFAGRPER
jgi:hypothetical protein